MKLLVNCEFIDLSDAKECRNDFDCEVDDNLN